MQVSTIENKQFAVKLRGYDQDEVDNFLDEIVAWISELLVAQRVSEAPTQPIPVVFGDMSRLLDVAQRTADEQLAQAHSEAGGILAEAEKSAQSIVAEGHEKRHAMIGQLEVQRTFLEERVKLLQENVDSHAEKLRSVLQLLETKE